MKKSLIVMGVLMTPLAAHAELSAGQECDACFKQNKDIPAACNCLSAEKDRSGKKLDALITETVKRIKANNINPFNDKEENTETAGDVYSKRFLEAQKSWKEYRDRLCLAVATELDEDAYDSSRL